MYQLCQLKIETNKGRVVSYCMRPINHEGKCSTEQEKEATDAGTIHSSKQGTKVRDNKVVSIAS